MGHTGDTSHGRRSAILLRLDFDLNPRIQRISMTSPKRSRRTRENTAVLLIDHQVALFTGVRDLTVSELKHNVVGLAKAARILGLPIVAVTTARDSMWGPTIPELRQVLGDREIMDRSSVNAWDDERFVKVLRDVTT
jgi:hypothetical protein